MFLVEIDDVVHIVFAGPAERAAHARITIVTPAGEHAYPVKNGVWMSQPEPFTAGMQVTGIWQDKDGGELFRLESPPLDPAYMRPLFGPGWTGYGPNG